MANTTEPTGYADLLQFLKERDGESSANHARKHGAVAIRTPHSRWVSARSQRPPSARYACDASYSQSGPAVRRFLSARPYQIRWVASLPPELQLPSLLLHRRQ
eukprot:scaffold347_cov239-Pinguiococcus_pyrenoidosus.AAC.2